MKFGEYVKTNIPKDKSLSKMAKEIGTTMQNVSNWLERERVPIKYLFEMADYLEIEPRTLKSKMRF